jgi:hypothetical protein
MIVCSIPGGANTGCTTSFTPTQALVIEYVQVLYLPVSGATPSHSHLNTSVGGDIESYEFFLGTMLTNGNSVYKEQLKIANDANVPMYFSASQVNGTGNTLVELVISGYTLAP